jgi:hypothetical protein
MLAVLMRQRAQIRQVLLAPMLGLPLTAAAAMGIAAMSPLLRGLGMTGGGVLQTTFGVGLSIGVGYLAGRSLSRTTARRSVHQRGTLIEGEHAVSAAGSKMSERGAGRHSAAQSSRDSAITLAGIAIAPLDETKHFKVIGTTGTGKSTAIHELLAAALERGDRAVIADPDGGYLRRFQDSRRADIILNPFDPGSLKWNLFGEIDNAYDVDQLSRSLIPDHGGSDRSWLGYARTFFGAVTRQAHEAGITDVAELYRLLVVADQDELRTLVAGTPAQPFLQEHNGRMFDSIRSVTSSAVGALDYVAQQTADPFSIRQWVRQGTTRQQGVLFIPYRAGQIAALRSTISAWMRLAIFEAMSQPEGDQRLWFVVDELDALGQIDGLKDALARLRKFGGRCVLGFQSIAQVSSTYGSGEAQTIVENCGNTLILRCSGSDHGGTANFASRLIGQIEQLPDLCGYLKFASVPGWQRVSLPPPEQPGVAQARADARGLWHRWRARRVSVAGYDRGADPKAHAQATDRARERADFERRGADFE